MYHTLYTIKNKTYVYIYINAQYDACYVGQIFKTTASKL